MTIRNHDWSEDEVQDLMEKVEHTVHEMLADHPEADGAEIEFESIKLVMLDATNKAAANEMARRYGYVGMEYDLDA